MHRGWYPNVDVMKDIQCATAAKSKKQATAEETYYYSFYQPDLRATACRRCALAAEGSGQPARSSYCEELKRPTQQTIFCFQRK